MIASSNADNLPLALLRADWVAPMDQPIISDGAVAFSIDQIVAVGRVDELTHRFPAATVRDLGRAVLLPGLVNAHAHLELTDAAPGTAPQGGFTGWLLDRIRQAAGAPLASPDALENAIRRGVDQCLRFGVTTVGDITRSPELTRPLLAAASLRVVSYGEVRAMAQNRALLDGQVARAIDPGGGDRLVAGISPHAPYSVEPDGYRRCLEVARANRLPLATHLAESPDEDRFLAAHDGPLRDLWDHLGRWDGDVPRFAGGPIRFAQALGLLDHPTLLAHVNYCDDAEMDLLAAGRASVVYCPRTHAFFGHPPHRWREMLARGINVAVGTDSCASSPDLNLVDDLRLLRRLAPELPAYALWEMATSRAARAIGKEREAGTLTAGKRADFVAYPAEGADPLAAVLDGDASAIEVWVGGRREGNAATN